MGNNNEVKYLIKLAADTSELKQDILAGKVDITKVKQLLTAAIKSARREANGLKADLDAGLNVDTTKLQGLLEMISGVSEEMERMGKPIKDWAKTGKTFYTEFTNMQNSVDALAQNVATLQGNVAKLNESFADFKSTYQSFNPAQFAGIASGANEAAQSVSKAGKKIQTAISRIEVAAKDSGGLKEQRKSLKAFMQTVQDFRMPKFKDMGLDELEAQIDRLDDEWEALDKKFSKDLAAYNKNQKPLPISYKKEAALIQAQQLALYDVWKTKAPSGGYAQQVVQDQMAAAGEMDKTISQTIDAIKSKLKELDDEINLSLKDSLSKVVSEQLSEIQLTLTLPEQDEFIANINKFINTLDVDKIQPVKINAVIDKLQKTNEDKQIQEVEVKAVTTDKNDSVANVKDKIAAEIAKLEAARKAQQDVYNALKDKHENRENAKDTSFSRQMNQILPVIEKYEQAIAHFKTLQDLMNDPESAKSVAAEWNKNQVNLATLGAKQDSMLARTEEWRLKMIKALSFSTKDLTFDWDGGVIDGFNKVYNDIQSYFEDTPINIKINGADFAKQIEGAINEKGLTLGGGGTATIDANDIANIIQSIFTGEPIPTRVVNQAQLPQSDDIADDAVNTEEVVESVAKLNRKAAQPVIDLLKRASSKADDSKGGQNLARYFNGIYGIDLVDIDKHKYDDDIDEKIFDLLQKSLTRPDKTGGAAGSTIGSDLQNAQWLKDNAINKGGAKSLWAIVTSLGRNIDDLLQVSGLKTESSEEAIRKYNRVSIVEKARAKHDTYFGAYAALNKVGAKKNFNKYVNNPDLLKVEDIDAAMSALEEVGGDVSALKKLKDAKLKLGDSKDMNALYEFKKAAYGLFDGMKDVSKWLDERMGKFKGEVYIQGRQHPMPINSPYQMANLKKDAIIADATVYSAFGNTYRDNPLMQARPHKQTTVENLVVNADKFNIQEKNEKALESQITVDQHQVDSIPTLEENIQQFKQNIDTLSQHIAELNAFIEQSQLKVESASFAKFDALNNYANMFAGILSEAYDAIQTGSTFNVTTQQQSSFAEADKLTGVAIQQLQKYTEALQNNRQMLEQNASDIARYEEIWSLSKNELEKRRGAAKEHYTGAEALAKFKTLRGMTMPSDSAWIERLVDQLGARGKNSAAFKRLIDATKNYESVNENDTMVDQKDGNKLINKKEYARKLLEEEQQRFIKDTASFFKTISSKYSQYDVKAERDAEELYKKELDYLRHQEVSSLPKEEIERRKSEAKQHYTGATALSQLNNLRNKVIPDNIADIINLANMFGDIGENTEAFEKLIDAANKYNAIRNKKEPSDQKQKGAWLKERNQARMAAEAAQRQFIEETQELAARSTTKYGKYSVQDEKALYALYSNAGKYKNHRVDIMKGLKDRKKQLVDERVNTQGYAKSILGDLSKKSDVANDQRTQEAIAVANQLRKIRAALYKEAAQYVKVLRDDKTDDATKKVTLTKLQQVLGGLKNTKASFAKIGHLTPNVALYDKKKQESDVDKWTKEFITQAASSNMLHAAQNQLEEQVKEKGKQETKLQTEQSLLTGAQTTQEDLAAAKKELEFVQQYNELLEKEKQLLQDISKLKKQRDWKGVKAKYKERDDVDKQINELLKQNPNDGRHAYAFQAAEQYEADIRIAASQRRVYSKQLAELKATENEIKKSQFFTGKKSAKVLNDFEDSLAKQFYERRLKEIDQAYGPVDSLTFEEKDKRDAEIERAKKARLLYKNQLSAKDNQLILTDYVKDENGAMKEVAKVIVENLQQALLNHAQIDAKRENIQKELKKKNLDQTISDLYASKKEAMRYGGVTQAELNNSKLVQEQNKLLANIEDLTKTKQSLDQQIEILEDKKANAGLSKKETNQLRKLKQERDDAEQKIADATFFVSNRDNLIQDNEAEKAANRKTAEENLALQTERLTQQKEKLRTVEEEITRLKEQQKATEKDSPEAERIKHALTDAKAKKKKINDEIENTQKSITGLQKSVEYQKKVVDAAETDGASTKPAASGGLLGAITSAVKEGVSGVTTEVDIDTSHLATEETLKNVKETMEKIHALLGGDGDWEPEAEQQDVGQSRNKKQSQEIDAEKVIANVRNAIGKFDMRSSDAAKAEFFNSLSEDVKNDGRLLAYEKNYPNLDKATQKLADKMLKLAEAAKRATGAQDKQTTKPIEDTTDVMSKLLEEQKGVVADYVKRGILSESDSKEYLRLLPQALNADENVRISEDDAKIWTALMEKIGSFGKDIDDNNEEIKDTASRQKSSASGGGLIGLMRTHLAQEGTLQKVLAKLGEIAKNNAMSGKPNNAQDLLEQFRRMLESDAWEGRERVAYMDLATGSMSNTITGDNESISAERLRILREAYAGKMDMNAKVHTHAGEDDPYFSEVDLKQAGLDFAAGIKQQILLSNNNMSVLDMTDVKDINGLLDALTKTEHNFEALAATADKFGAKYVSKAFGEITPQGLVKMLGIKGVESKLNESETRSKADESLYAQDAKEAASIIQKSTGESTLRMVEKYGAELRTTIESTDTKGNKKWSVELANKYEKAKMAIHQSILDENLKEQFGGQTDARKTYNSYLKTYEELQAKIKEFKQAPEDQKVGLQAEIDKLQPKLDKLEEKLVKLIKRKEKFLGDKTAVAMFNQTQLGTTGESLRALMQQRHGDDISMGENIATRGLSETENGSRLIFDVLKNGQIRSYALEVDRVTGQVKEFMLAENALANAFLNVNKAMQFNETVIADIAGVTGLSEEEMKQWLATANSPELRAYQQAMQKMQEYTQYLWSVKQGNASQDELNHLMALSEKTIQLGKNAQKAALDFQKLLVMSDESDIFTANIDTSGGDRNKAVRDALEEIAQSRAFSQNKKYDFMSFDNDKLRFKLTDVAGNIEQVELRWNELYKMAIISSDKSVAALDPLVQKIEDYKQKIADAKNAGYLVEGSDEKFNEVLQEIDALVQSGTASFEELEEARNRALGIGAGLDQEITSNKRRVGTNAVNSATAQYYKIIGSRNNDLGISKENVAVIKYERAYDDLIQKYKDYVRVNKQNSPEVQNELRKDAAVVQKLGRELLKSTNEAERLNEAVKNSSSFINRHGEPVQLGDFHKFTDKEMQNKVAAMRAYAEKLYGAEAASFKLNTRTMTLEGTLRENDRVVHDVAVQWNAAAQGVYAYEKAEREHLTGLPAFVKGFQEKLKAITQYLMSMTSIYRVIGEIRKGIQYIKEIDAALVELRKVTDKTDEEYAQFLQTASKTADRLGSTISAVTEATATFAKLGYTMEMAAEMAEAAIVYKNVGDNIASTEDAANSIISTLKGFGLEASEAMRIVDRFNEVGNRFAITSQGLGEALRLSASALSEGGNTLDESIGIITAANEVVNDPSSVGTALKTLTLRLRGSKTELEEMGEDVSDMATTTSQLQAKLLALTGGQVDIMLDQNTFKSSTQILREMAEAWENMTDIQRASALELMGGKRQANVLSALIQNFDTAEKAIEASANSAGSALRENEVYLDSIQGKLDILTNATQTMWSNLLDSDVVKDIVSLATALVKVLDAVGPLNVAFVGLFAFLEKKFSLLGNLFNPAGNGVKTLEEQLIKAKENLAKAEEYDLKRGTDKTAEKRRNAQERVEILQKKIDDTTSIDPEIASLIGDRDAFSKEVDAMKTKRDELRKAIESDSADNMLKLIEIDMTSIDDEIAEAQEKLKTAQQTLSDAQAEPVTNKVKGGIRKNRDRDKHIADASKEIADIEKDLDDLQKKKADTIHYAAQFDLAEMDESINAASNKLDGMTTAINAKTAAQNASNAATGAGAVVDEAAANATGAKTASTWADVAAEITRKGATGASIAATLQQVIATKLAGSALVQKGAIEKGVMITDLATLGVTQLLTLGFYGLTASIKTAIAAMWTLMTTTPLGPILLIVAAVAAAIGVFSHFHKTTKELKEELNGLKSELSDIRSELDAVNSELKTTNERMAELLAKDKLTFEEQEELDRLRETNDELERRKELLETEEESKSGMVGRKAAKVVDSMKSKKDWWENWLIGDNSIFGHFETTEDEEVKKNIDKYKKLQEKYNNASSLKEKEKYQKKLDKKADKIDAYISELSDALEGVEYGDSAESDAALDYLAELQDNYGIARGSASAKTNAIKGIMNKKEFSAMSNAIDYYVEALKNGEDGAEDAIAEIINDNEDFIEDLEARGLEAQDAIDLYTQLGEDMHFDTMEGKVEEIKRATEKLPYAFNNISQFMDGDTVDKTAVAEYFKGTSEKTREEIAQLIQDIKDGNIDVENALKKFDIFGVQSVVEIEITEVQTNFKDTFTDLDGADGLIDTFQELADAIGSTSNALDALNAAQAEMKANGRVSIETALKLMEYTDDYSNVLTISEGKLVLAENAEENLIEARIEGMKASAMKALEEAKAARETTVLARSTAETALSTYNSAIESEMAAAVTATAWDKVLAAAAGLWAGIKSLFTNESWTDAYNRAYQQTLNSLSGNRVAQVEAKYASAEEKAKKAKLEQDIKDADKAIEEQDKEIAKLQGNADLINGLNKDNIGDVFKSDDFDTVEDAIKDGWDKLVAKYENQLALITNERDLIETEIDKAEARGGKASARYYEDLIRNSNEEKELLEQKKAALENYLKANQNAIDQDTWTEYNNEINETAVAIKECETNTIEWANAIREIDMHYFEKTTEAISQVGEELDFVNSLLEDEDVADENGNWSDAAITRIGLYTQQMEKAAAEAQLYQEQIDKLNEAYEKGERSEEQYQEELADLVGGQQDAINSYEDAKDGIVELNEARIDAIKEGIEKEIEAYEDYIDVVKETLDAERDLYDFKKNIQKQSKDIASLERRIASLSSSTNASDIAERRKLEAELLEAREGLNDTYYEHSLDVQSQALDEESEAFSKSQEEYIKELEDTLDNVEILIEQSIMDMLLNADIVLAQLIEISTTYGINLSETLTQPWEDASVQAIAWKNELQQSMTSGEYAALIGSGGAITAFANGVADKLTGSWDSAKTAVKGYSDFLTGSELGDNFSKTITGFGNQIQSLVTKWNNVKAAADSAYEAQTRAQNVGGNNGNNGAGGTPQPDPPEVEVTIGGATEGYRPGVGGGGSFESRIAVAYKYAKGTMGTSSDQWAITDEPWLGDELVLVPTASGNLSYMRKGTSVVPADITKNLVEWGKLNPDTMKIGGGANINMISNAVNKPELNFEFDSLVHVDHCDEGTLKDLEKMVDNKINQFSKQMNYALKRVGSR